MHQPLHEPGRGRPRPRPIGFIAREQFRQEQAALHEPRVKSGGEPPHSIRFAIPQPRPFRAKRLECGRFTGAFRFLVTARRFAAASLGLLLWWVTVITPAATVLGAGSEVRRTPTVEAIARVMPAVVNIGTETVVEVRDPFEQMLREFWGPYYRQRPAETQYSLGSGVIIDEAGYVLTNDHVVRRATSIWVKLSEEAGGGVYEAERVAGATTSDVALLRIKAEPNQKFQAVKFAADDDLFLGETVIALGNPFGLGGSVSAGILSSKSRRPAIEGVPLGVEDWLQTDAAINPGNSGGPLINLEGELIGLSVAVYREGQGIGFAVPVRRVSEALAELLSPGQERLWFGARLRPTTRGLAVAGVEPGSPAEKAGLHAGDDILQVNGSEPRGLIDFNHLLLKEGERRDVQLEVERDGSRRKLQVRLVREASVFNAALIRQKLGLSVQEITPELADQMGLVTREGLLIAGVDKDSEPARAGVRRGQVLLGLDGAGLRDVVSTARLLRGRAKGDKVTADLLVLRTRGRLIFPQRAQVELTVQ